MGFGKKLKKALHPTKGWFSPKGKFGPLGKTFHPVKGVFGPKGKFGPIKGVQHPWNLLGGKAKGKPLGGAKERYPYKFE